MEEAPNSPYSCVADDDDDDDDLVVVVVVVKVGFLIEKAETAVAKVATAKRSFMASSVIIYNRTTKR